MTPEASSEGSGGGDSFALRRPLVSIGMPVRNGERFVARALESLLAQDMGDFELIISDNASEDRTAEICRSYAGKDSRIRLETQRENLGAAENFNTVFRLSRGEYFMWAACDDLWDPGFITACLEALQKHPEAVVAHPSIRVIDEEDRTLYVGRVEPEKAAGSPWRRVRWVIGHPLGKYAIYGLIRRSALEGSRLLGPVAGADILLVLELACKGPFVLIDAPLFAYRETTGITKEDRIRSLVPEGVRIEVSSREYDQEVRKIISTASNLSHTQRLLSKVVAWHLRHMFAADGEAKEAARRGDIGGAVISALKLALLNPARILRPGSWRWVASYLRGEGEPTTPDMSS